MSLPDVVSRDEWVVARTKLLEKEKAATRSRDALNAERRRLPMVRFRADYPFTTPDREATLLELFDGLRQLVVYQFMDNGPDDYCPGCTAYTDNTDTVAGRTYLHERQTTYVTLSDMPLPQITHYRQHRGWSVPFFSSHGSTFSADCGTGGGFGLSAFVRDGNDVFRSYFTNGRGVDRLRFDMNIFDLTALGRQEGWEETPNGWPRAEGRFEVVHRHEPAGSA